MRSSRLILVLAALVASFLVTTHSADAKPDKAVAAEASCSLPESNAEALQILSAFYPNKYVWDHSDLTVAVQAAPNLSPQHIAAVRAAIGTWDAVLRDCFDNQITLTDVTGQPRRQADIILHYVGHAGGAVFAGMAVCNGAGKCNNVLVSSEFGAPTNAGYTPQYLGYVTLHELGHALGLGHATNLEESTDLMGYGWIGDAPDPLFSQCDLDALASLFSPLLSGGGPSPIQSTFDCAGA